MTSLVSNTFRQRFNNVSAASKLRAGVALATIICIFSSSVIPSAGQGLLRQRLRQRMQQGMQQGDQQQQSVETGAGGSSCHFKPDESISLDGVDVAIWRPKKEGPAPLVIFSHGFHGRNTQSTFLMKALSDAGYLVVAPNHRDALGSPGGFSKADEPLGKPQKWDASVYKDRADDIKRVLQALQKDARFANAIDWSKVAASGHSLGGYTIMGLAGGWPSWKVPSIKAVVALSPYAQPFGVHDTVSKIDAPILYESGTRDLGILPSLVRKGGVVDQTKSPCEFVEFDQAGHFAFTDLNKNAQQRDAISYYCVAFLNKYLRNDNDANPEKVLPGVVELKSK